MKSLVKNSLFIMTISVAFFLCAQAQAQKESELSIRPKTPAIEKTKQPKNYAPYPQPDAGYVTDLGNLLTVDEEERIERWLWQAESKTRLEVIVVTITSVQDYMGKPKSLADSFDEQVREKYGAIYRQAPSSSVSIETFARGMFDAYGIGNMPENNGVLLLVAVKDRKACIELGAGYGHERDMDARRIVDNEILPYFRKEDYAGGIMSGVKAILLEFGGLRVGYNWPLITVAGAIPVVGLISYSLFRSGKRGWGWICVGLLIVLVLALLYILRQTLRHMPKGRSSGWSSGGIGGFGGGFSGGGGATGSW